MPNYTTTTTTTVTTTTTTTATTTTATTTTTTTTLELLMIQPTSKAIPKGYRVASTAEAFEYFEEFKNLPADSHVELSNGFIYHDIGLNRVVYVDPPTDITYGHSSYEYRGLIKDSLVPPAPPVEIVSR